MKYIFVIFLFISIVTSIPQFHKVNDRFYNGTQCPAITRYHVICPTLCVTDQSLCPSSSSCPTGSQLCKDGTCQVSCAGRKNICSCQTKPGIELIACQSPVYTDIQDYKAANNTQLLYASCSSSLNVLVKETWADVESSNLIWNVCPPPKGMDFPIKVPVVYISLSLYLAFFVFWAIYYFCKKMFKVKSSNKTDQNEDVVETTTGLTDVKVIEEKIIEIDNSVGKKLFSSQNKKTRPDITIEKIEQQVDSDEEDKIKQTYYKNEFFGRLVIIYMSIVSVMWMVILLVLSLDYYGYVITGVPFGLFYGSYELSSKAFCFVWNLSTAWYLVMNIYRSKIKNHFRTPSNPEKCDYVMIQKKRKVIQMMNYNEDDHHGISMMYYVEILEKTLRKWFGLETLVKTVPVLLNKHGQRYFEFQSTRYTHYMGKFIPAQIDMSMVITDLVQMNKGLSQTDADNRLEEIGPNFIEVVVPSFFNALWEELTGVFYIYQIMILWCYFYLAYWQIGISDTLVIVIAAVIKVVVRLKSEKRIKKMAEYLDVCQVMRNNAWHEISTSDLVPGDLIKIEAEQVVPVDAVILEGDIVVDESSLTGEPLPIRKFLLREGRPGEIFDPQLSGKNNSLFAGTTIKQANENSRALVLKTRTNTDKGRLIQRILFPQPVSFIFNEQLKLVFCMLLVWALVLLGFGAWWLGGNGMTAWFYGTTAAAQVINPLLPAILVVGQSVAAERLKKKGVFCVDFPRILMAGKVQVFCFDKTGTLTHEGLEYYGAYPSHNGIMSSSRVIDLDEKKEEEEVLAMGMACCHSVTTLDGDYIGNPVDIVMFKYTNATIETVKEHDMIRMKNGKELEVLKRFEFQHARASMSIAVKDTSTNHIHLFCKGSFERIQEMSTDVPINKFQEISTREAREGCYVLGMSHRDLGTSTEELETTVRSWTRDQMESQLEYSGLILFKNLLKPDTTDAILQLKQGDVRTVMITGDNALTGVCIGQQCGMVPQNTQVILGDISKNHHSSMITWTDITTNQIVSNIEPSIQSGAELALTGKAFQRLVQQGKMRNYLFATRIFARMTPTDKMICVELFMEKAITAMCGDGGNDCGALRTAHVGIAMSEAEASVVSSFSTPHRSVQSCVELLIQGRSALATSFASYKYLIMYGETMALSKFTTFYYTLSFSQWNYILIDAFITVFCSFAVTQAGSAKRLSNHRPTARILGPEVLLSVLGQILINGLFLAGVFIWLYKRDDFFRCREWDSRATEAYKWWLLGDSFEADVLTFMVLYQFVNTALIFNYGYIFRASWYRNYLLLFFWSLFIAIVSYWELADPNRFGCLVRLNCGNPDVLESLGYPRPNFYIEPYNNLSGHNVLPRPFRYRLWAYSIGNMVLCHIWERFFVLGPVRQYLRTRFPLRRLKISL